MYKANKNRALANLQSIAYRHKANDKRAPVVAATIVVIIAMVHVNKRASARTDVRKCNNRIRQRVATTQSKFIRIDHSQLKCGEIEFRKPAISGYLFPIIFITYELLVCGGIPIN